MLSFEGWLAVVALGLLAALVLCVWRFTSIVSRMSEYGVRFAERNDMQRDRLVAVMLEKIQVSGADTVKLAHLHASEFQAELRDELRRDGADTDAARRARHVQESLIKDLNRGEHPDLTEKDAQV